jgi:hypothetical protein
MAILSCLLGAWAKAPPAPNVTAAAPTLVERRNVRRERLGIAAVSGEADEVE